MPRKALMLACCAGLLCVVSLRAEETGWSRFRGPNGDGVAKNQNIPTKFSEESGILWKTPIPGLGNSSPVVWKDLIFVQSSSSTGDQRMLLCFDARTGKQNWMRTLPGKKAPPGRLHAKSSLASQTPVTDGESVFASFWDGRDVILAAYSIKGDPLWTKNLGPWVSQHGSGSSPILYKDKIIYFNDMDQFDEKKEAVARPSILIALDKKNGAVKWEMPREAFRACYSTPFLVEKPGKSPELIVTSTTAISSINPELGSENWTWKWTFTSKMPLRTVAGAFIANGMLFAMAGDGGGDRQMYAVSVPEAGAPQGSVWQNKKDFPYVPCCLANGANIYFANDRGFAGCFDAKTGKKIWLERLPEATFSSSPVLVDGNVYAPSEQGVVFVFAADPTFKLLAQNNLGEVIRSTPAVADGRMYIRGQNHLFCIGKK